MGIKDAKQFTARPTVPRGWIFVSLAGASWMIVGGAVLGITGIAHLILR